MQTSYSYTGNYFRINKIKKESNFSISAKKVYPKILIILFIAKISCPLFIIFIYEIIFRDKIRTYSISIYYILLYLSAYNDSLNIQDSYSEFEGKWENLSPEISSKINRLDIRIFTHSGILLCPSFRYRFSFRFIFIDTSIYSSRQDKTKSNSKI